MLENASVGDFGAVISLAVRLDWEVFDVGVVFVAVFGEDSGGIGMTFAIEEKKIIERVFLGALVFVRFEDFFGWLGCVTFDLGVEIIFVIIGGDVFDAGFDETLWVGKMGKQSGENDDEHSEDNDDKNHAAQNVVGFAAEIFGTSEA